MKYFNTNSYKHLLHYKKFNLINIDSLNIFSEFIL